jgi:exosome complex component RRP42
MDTSNLTKKRIKDYLDAGKRFDDRKFLDHREIEIETDVSKNAEGSAKVKLGNTEVRAGVKLGMGVPYPDHEDEGTMMTTLELLPLSSENFEYGPPRINAIEIARIVDRGIRESGMIDFKKLCVEKGEKVWTVFIDLYSINDDGNLLDACALAAVAALVTAKMPKYDEKEEKVCFGEWTSKKVPITKNIPITFTFHKIGKNIILDPKTDEEAASEARLSIALSSPGKDTLINAMQKGNETTLSEEEILQIVDSAEKKYKEIEKDIFNKIEKGSKGKK